VTVCGTADIVATVLKLTTLCSELRSLNHLQDPRMNAALEFQVSGAVNLFAIRVSSHPAKR
jgi:hypothetical protein